MDSAIIGALIGIGVMACGVCTITLHANWNFLRNKWRDLRKQDFPVAETNPLFVRQNSSQFKISKILPVK